MGKSKDLYAEIMCRIERIEDFWRTYFPIKPYCENCGASNFEQLDEGYITCMVCGEEKEYRE